MLKSRRIYVALAAALAVCFVIGVSAPDMLAQKSGKGRYRKVALKRDARKDGYTTTAHGTVINFEANDVIDPITKKLLEALRELEYRCTNEDPSLTRLPLRFTGGRSERRTVSCLILIEPKILILDEPAPGES